MIQHLNHVAIIPDGNRRWTKLYQVPVLEGHRRGAKVMHTVVDYLIAHGVKYLTVWGFSTDNWKRSDDEIKDLLHLLAFWIDKDAPWLNEHGVRLRHIGRLDQLPDFLQLAINQAVELTKNNEGMTLNLAFNYTGRGEIVDAVRKLVADLLFKIAFNYGGPYKITDEVHRLVAAKLAIFTSFLTSIPSDASEDEKLFSHYLYTDGMPDVDLVIRTAGEFRLSNFLLWQTAYSEYYFTEVLWPDFDTKELEKALEAYSERRRRFGGD